MLASPFPDNIKIPIDSEIYVKFQSFSNFLCHLVMPNGMVVHSAGYVLWHLKRPMQVVAEVNQNHIRDWDMLIKRSWLTYETIYSTILEIRAIMLFNRNTIDSTSSSSTK